jgi:hypothetical protein
MWHGEEGREVRSRSNQVENGGAALTVKGGGGGAPTRFVRRPTSSDVRDWTKGAEVERGSVLRHWSGARGGHA